MRFRFAVLILLGGALLAAVAGCHRRPSADVVATVNGKEILRSDLDRNYQASLGDAPQKLSRRAKPTSAASDPAPDDRGRDPAAARRQTQPGRHR